VHVPTISLVITAQTLPSGRLIQEADNSRLSSMGNLVWCASPGELGAVSDTRLVAGLHCTDTVLLQPICRNNPVPGQIIVWAEQHDDAFEAVIHILDGRAVQQFINGVQNPGR